MQTESFFDINGIYGFSAYGQTDYKTPEQLLAHMDELGVARCAVRCNTARESGNVPGNAKLLADLRATGQMGRRLIPVFVTSPAMYYDSDQVDRLAQTMQRENARMVALYPALGRFYLWETEPVLERLAHLNPVVCLSAGDIEARGGFDAFVRLAGAFPTVQFIITTVMWGHTINALDCMRRCDNVHLESSWLHTRAAVEQIVRRFGAQRLIFGLGPHSNAGSSIAALLHADITDQEREQVAHGNIERLLGLEPIAYQRTPAPDKPLWEALRRGEKLTEVDIVDAHIHLGPSTLSFLTPEPGTAEQSAALMRVERDRIGVNLMLVSFIEALHGEPVSGNRAYRDIHPEALNTLIKGYYSFNPHHHERQSADLLEAFKNPFFIGFKILPDYWHIPGDDPRYRPVWQYANAHRLPVLIHTWQGPCDPPAMFEPAIREFPDAQFLLGHSGGGDVGRAQAEDLCERYPNVYLEFCGSFTATRLWEDTIARLGTDKIVYGSDTCGHDSAWELGRLLSINVPDERLIPILGANMRRILAMRR